MTFLMGLNRWYSTPKSDAKAIHKLDTLLTNQFLHPPTAGDSLELEMKYFPIKLSTDFFTCPKKKRHNVYRDLILRDNSHVSS